MSYKDLLVTIWQLAFHCFSSIRVVIILYGMQHIEDKYYVVIVTFVLRVLDDMTVYVFINGDKLPDSAFMWTFSLLNGKLKY